MTNILLGITGSIAAYKCVELVRLLRKSDFNVKVVLTDSAKEFVASGALRAVNDNLVYDDMFDPSDNMSHIHLAKWADKALIAPASANSIAYLAQGLAHNLLSTICLATKAPITIAPAMNRDMWNNIATQDNVNILKSRNIEIIGPDMGEQACGDVGEGRMLEPEVILKHLLKPNTQAPLYGKTVLITAGPTQEPIDPVRYIGNRSSGKMGYALAQAAIEAGADVILISGPTHLEKPKRVLKFMSVNMAEEMYDAVMSNIDQADIFISTAAVADYRPHMIKSEKIKKQNDVMTLELKRNPDILQHVSELEKKPLLIGFAAETHDLIKNAKAKLQTKSLDLIIANQIHPGGEPFNSDQNEVYLIDASSETHIERSSKDDVAKIIIRRLNQARQTA